MSEKWDTGDFERAIRDAIQEDNRRIKEFAGEGWIKSMELFRKVGWDAYGLVIEVASGEVFKVTVERCIQ